MKAIQAVAIALIAGIVAFAPRADTQEANSEATGKVKAKRIFAATTTNAGQPIKLPQGNVEVVVWMYDIPAGSKLPIHKHPSQRYAYVLQGTLQVTDVAGGRSFEYKPGDFIVEMVDGWHYGANNGRQSVRLLVIDQVEKGQANTILK
jgi:quercetin dioxygenase-like cupin family protein